MSFVHWSGIAAVLFLGSSDLANAQLYGTFDQAVAAAPADRNYAQCLLDGLPGASNGAVTSALVRQCISQFPDGFRAVIRGAGTQRWFSFGSRDECVLAKGKGTTDGEAARMIAMACYCLYGNPEFANQRCSQ